MAAEKTSLPLRSPLLLALGISVAACHPPQPSPPPEGQAPERPAPEHRVPERLRDQPGGFVPVALADSPSMPPACAQCPSGNCTTSRESWCGGMAPPSGWEKQRAKEEEFWICEPVPAGCPVRRPESGAPCSEEGRQCAYGACNFELARCTGGHWQQLEVHPM